MRCDICKAPCWENYQIRRHPDSPKHADWHIHYCIRHGYLHDYRELAKIMIA